MPNIFFNIKVTAPAITNDIRVSIYDQSDPNTVIASQQQNAPHLDQLFSFPGLPESNLTYKIEEALINSPTIVSLLGQANFVGANQTIQYKHSVWIRINVDNIPGTSTVWPDAVSTVTVPDFIGWELQAAGRVGQYPAKRDLTHNLDYSYNAATGVIQLLQIGDTFQDGEDWYFEFDPIIQTSSGGTGNTGSGGVGFTEILLVTTNTVLTAADIGKKILIDPAGNYLEITLPDYTAIAANTITYFEMVSSTSKCARIKCYSGQNISWLQILSDLYIKPNESFELYKRVVSTGVYQWRVQNNCGNFLDVGELFYSDLSTDKIFNAIELDGANVDIQKEARLYNQFVVRNGIAILYADWSSSNIFTRMKFSLKDTASNNFRVPDAKATPVYLRPLSSGVSAGDYIAQQLAQHQHMQSIGELPSPPFGQTGLSQKGTIGNYNSVGNVRFDLTSRAAQFNSATGLWTIIDGTENRPNTRATRLYIKC